MKPFRYLKIVFALSVLCLLPGLASRSRAGVMMQGFYYNAPSPGSGNAGAQWWWDHLAAQANSLRQSGISAIWLPPCRKGAAGGYSVGYDPYDDYDLGSKNQAGTIPTRYGTREQLERCVAMLRANGMDVYMDIVDNHRGGDPGNSVFQYVNAYGNYPGGRFEKHPLDFHPGVSQDPNVFLGTGENFTQFGRDLAPINGAKPTGASQSWMYANLLASGDWLTKALDIQGFRLDDVKGQSTDFMYNWLNYGAMAGKFAVGEFFDGNNSLVEAWLNYPGPPGNAYGMAGRASAFDFSLRFTLQSMCNGPSGFDMSTLDHTGLIGIDPGHAVTFVENHDTDRSSPIVQNKALAYAYILTSEGYPCVFYRDYSADAGSYGLKPVIDPLIWIHEKLAFGSTQQRWKDHDVFCYERQSYPNLITGLNNNGSTARTITVQTGFGNNVALHDYTGHGGDVTTNGSGSVTITIPANVNGAGYVCYSRAGITGSFSTAGGSVTQEYAGAQDLDIKPADPAALNQVCRVYALAGQPIVGTLNYDVTGWNASTAIYLELDSPQSKILASRTFFRTTKQGTAISATAPISGWHVFKIRAYNVSAANPKPNFWLRATYTAPQTPATTPFVPQPVAPTNYPAQYLPPPFFTRRPSSPEELASPSPEPGFASNANRPVEVIGRAVFCVKISVKHLFEKIFQIMRKTQ